MKRIVIKTYLDFLNWSKTCGDIISFDTETSSLSYLHLSIIGFSICDGESVCYLDLFKNKDFVNIIGLLNKIFWNCEKVIMHNAPFDLKVLYKYGIGESLGGKVIDTRIAAFLLDENRLTGLKFLTANILGKKRLSWKQITEKYGISSPEFYNYAMNDAEDTWNLWKIFEKQLKKEDLSYLFYSVEMPFQFVIRDMKINGVGVDKQKLLEFDEKCVKLLFELEVDLLKTLGIKPQIQKRFDNSEELLCDLDFNSSQQMVKIIEKLGLEIKEKTKPSKTYPEGQKSVGAATLLNLRGKHPFIEKLHYYRYVRHLYDSFVKKIQFEIQEDGRIRGNFNIAKSGRLTMSKPNLQQNPNDEKYGFKSPIKFREIFVPKKVKRPEVVHCKKENYDIYVGRPSKWGNPFEIGKDGTREEVIDKYKKWILNQPDLLKSLWELEGKTLGCWCKPEICHADILADLVEEFCKYVYIIADYSGQELRNLGEVTNDTKIIEAFRQGYDLHLLTANFIFSLNLKEEQLKENGKEYIEIVKKFKSERHKAKNGANFPIIYGTTASGISKRMGISYKEAKRWMNEFFKLYPNVKKAIEETKIELENNGYVKTLMGRKRRFPNYENQTDKYKAADLRIAFNHKIQGFSADQVKIALSKIAAGIKDFDAKIILQVHDEVIVECKKDQAEKIKAIVKNCMENAVSLRIPFKVDIKICERYEK